MKVSFIVPSYSNFWNPLGLGYIISYCKKNYKDDLEFEVLFEKFDDVHNIDYAIAYSDIVGVTCTTPTFNRALEYCKRAKFLNPNVKTVIGGWHPTVSPAHHIKTGDYDYVNHWIRGEGELSFLKILNNYAKYEISDYSYLRFDDLPWPDRKSIRDDLILDYCESNFGERITSIQSIRGCKFSCKMCGESLMSGNCVRVRDPEDTLDEIEYLIKDYKVDRIKFVDATWAVSESVVNEFCEAKIKRGIDIKWDAMIHAGIATENMIKIMAEANCDIIMVGVESGDDRILRSIKKGTTTTKIKKVFDWGRKYNIQRRAFIILGTPLECPESIDKTYKFIETIDPDIVSFSLLCEYPGTEYYNRIKDQDIDWTGMDEYSNDHIESNYFSNEELKAIQKVFNTAFYGKLVAHKK